MVPVYNPISRDRERDWLSGVWATFIFELCACCKWLHSGWLQCEAHQRGAVQQCVRYLMQRAAGIAVGRRAAAGVPEFTFPSIRTLISTNQGEQSPADHNPLLHLHTKRLSERGKWDSVCVVCVSTTEPWLMVLLHEGLLNKPYYPNQHGRKPD